MNIELLQYLQSKVELQIEVRDDLRINIGTYEVECYFSFGYEKIDELLAKLKIYAFEFRHGVKNNDAFRKLLEKIKDYWISIAKYDVVDEEVTAILKKLPKFSEYQYPKYFYSKIDFTVFEILIKYNELHAEVFCSPVFGLDIETSKFKIRGSNNKRNLSFTLPSPDYVQLETFSYESFNITDYGYTPLNSLVCLCNIKHRGVTTTEAKSETTTEAKSETTTEAKSEELTEKRDEMTAETKSEAKSETTAKKQDILCEKCQEHYDGIVRKYDSLFELMCKLKTKRKMISLDSKHMENKKLNLIDEIKYYLRVDSEENFEEFKEYAKLAARLGFKGLLSYQNGIRLGLRGKLESDLINGLINDLKNNLPFRLMNRNKKSIYDS